MTRSAWSGFVPWAVLLASSALASGCFAEVSGGGYAVKFPTGSVPAYSLGVSLGVFIDPGPFGSSSAEEATSS